MNKYDRQASENWFNYKRYNHVHESVLASFRGYFLSDAFYEILIATKTELYFQVEIKLLNGYRVFIHKWADVKNVGAVTMCQTRRYKYLARHPLTKHQIRYDSPHLGVDQEKENWDYYHHRHHLIFEKGFHDESVIVYSPFVDPQQHQFNKVYFTSKDKKRYSFKREPWPQVEDFLNEVVALGN